MIVIFTGRPGAGKSYKLAQTALDVLYTQRKIKEKWGLERILYSNLRFSPVIEEEFRGQIKYWTDPAELIDIRNADVLWDEIATHLDSSQYANMSLEIKRWLQQHRKFGIDIYGTTQDFSMIDISMRRMTSDLMYLSKVFGSRDKSTTKPPVKYVWGLIMLKSLDPVTYSEDEKTSTGIPKFMWLSRAGVDVFDTAQEIKMGQYPPLNHIHRSCIRGDCKFQKIIHA
jgi:hypothetical protein